VDNGKIIETGVPQKLIKKHVGKDVLEVPYNEVILKALKEELPEADIEIFGEQIRVFVNRHGVFERIVKKFPGVNMTIRNANLEDVFLKLTGRKLRE
jgi:lipooligosaccharide transport system ATP-binding protein